MSEIKERYKVLIGIRNDIISKLRKQVPELASQLEVILGFIDEYTPLNRTEEIHPALFNEGQQSIFKKLKPVQAVKKVFNDFPNKQFAPPELRDYLQNLKNTGELQHIGKNILTTTHTAIRVLLKQDFIEKIREDPYDDPTYKLKK